MATVSRGILITLALVVGLLIVAACTPVAGPAPAAAPTQPAPAAAAKPPEASPVAPKAAAVAPTAAAKPAAATPVAAKPVATAAAKSAPEPAWKVEWEKVIAAANKEGKVVVSGAQGDRFRDAAMEFEKAYPGIKVEYSGMPSRDIIPKIKAERESGLYLWDVYGGGWTTVNSGLKEFLAPLRPAIILPEVLDDSKWLSGFDAGFVDEYTFAFFAYWANGAYVNRNVAPQSEMRTLDNLVDPKWKGKISWADPRNAGMGRAIAATVVARRGEDFYRKLLAQDVVPFADTRRLAEDLVRGRYPIAFGIRVEDLAALREVGLLAKVEPLEETSYVATGSGHVGLFDKAPNPNAAKLFINWLLTKEGQRVHVQAADVNSRRLDVDGPAETAVPPGYEYSCSQFEQWPYNDKVLEISREMLR